MVQKNRKLLSAISSRLSFNEQGLTVAELQAVRRRVVEINEAHSVALGITLFMYFLTGLVLIQITVIPEYQLMTMTIHVIALLVLGLIGRMKFQKGRSITRAAIVGSVVGSLVLSAYSVSFFQKEVTPDQKWIGIISLCLVNGILLILAPSQDRGWKRLAVFFSANMSLAIVFAEGRFFSFAVVTSVVPIAVVIKAFLVNFIKNEALSHYRLNELASKAERQRFEHEMILARRIQDSFVDGMEFDYGMMHVRLYHSKHEKVGGDWCASRTMADGRLFIVVADATGKGMHAALVIHAVQALWADAISDAQFDAQMWIERVNRTLFRLGRKEPQTLTMAILEISEDHLKYWSAGQTPLFVVRTLPGGDQVVKTLVGRGGIVGFESSLKMVPAEYQFMPRERYHLLFGTDGFFENGTLYGRRRILQILEKIKDSNSDILSESKAEDDKTLIWIDRAA